MAAPMGKDGGGAPASASSASGGGRLSGTAVARGLLEEVLTDEFFETYWEKKPFHRSAAKYGRTGNRLPEAFSTDDIFSVVQRAGPALKIFRRSEPLHTENFMAAYLDGASLVVNQSDRLHEVLFTLCKSLADRLFHHVFSVTYLTPPGSQAVRLHTDDQDVILLQVFGKKRWKIRNNPTRLPYTEEMLGKDAPVPPELIGDPVLEFTIEPHDFLYIPRGFLHEADTGDEPSLHLTITVPTSDYCWGVQMVKHFINQLPRPVEQPLLGSSLCRSHGLDDKELDAGLQGLLDSWLGDISADGVIDAFGQRMARTNEAQERQFAQMSAIDPRAPPNVTEQSRVRLMPSVTVECDEAANVATFSRESDGGVMECPIPRTSAPLMRALTNRPQLVADLPCSDAFERVCVLQLLNRQGVVQLFVPGDDD